MKRETVQYNIFYEVKSKQFTWKDLKSVQFQDDDIIDITYDEGYYSENDSWDPYFIATVVRTRPETDEEMDRRIKKNEETQKELKERRRETYLKLKKEFEP